MSFISSPRALGCQPRHQPDFLSVDRREPENWDGRHSLLTMQTTFLLKEFWASATYNSKDRCVSDKGKKGELGNFI